jgi:transcriptional regulator
VVFVPPPFREDRLPILHDAIRRARLATLVTFNGEEIEASHVPILLDPALGPKGTLYGHLSRGNLQLTRAAAAIPALAILGGPDAYISPSWYATKKETGKVVPTWNYVAVHVYGPIETFDDKDQLLAIVTRLTERHEESRPEPWAVSEAPEAFIAAKLREIIGFKLRIDRLEGKWKLSQNRSREDCFGVIKGLRHEDGAAERATADLMAQNMARSDGNEPDK